ATTIAALGSQTLQNNLSAAQVNILGTIGDLAGTKNNALTIGTAAGQGSVTFSGPHTYTGTTEAATARLGANNLMALAGLVHRTKVATGAALQLESSVDEEPLTLFGNGPVAGTNGHNTGALESIANNNTYAGPITLGSNATIGVASGSTLTITGAIGDGGKK